MKIVRAKTSDIVSIIKPHFVDDKSCDKDEIARDLVEMLDESPDAVCVLVVTDDTQYHNAVGHVVAWRPYKRKWIWVDQAWMSSEVDKKVRKAVFKKLKRWAIDTFNIHELRCETHRNPKTLERSWGWKVWSTVMSLKI